MNFEQRKELCLTLLHSDDENQVVEALKKVGYWENPDVWREYGDNENNFAVIGNQQSRPDAALVEKLINSIDARLMAECLKRGKNPEGPGVPSNIHEAVATYFEEPKKFKSVREGKIRNWSDEQRTAVAKGITLAATGKRPKQGNPCFTIVDVGEGQTPNKFPSTLLSLTKSNKLRIPFVQGKFNMGGTGVLQFCGKHNLQLILSKRHPEIAARESDDSTADFWGFTIVRREDPREGRRSSVYRYLAPLNRGVLYFPAEELPLMPQNQNPYGKTIKWGTLIKLYDYAITGYKSNIMFDLLHRLDLLLPEPALPIRLYECRPYGGHKGSLDTSLCGLSVRLSDDRAENLEKGFPDSAKIRAAKEEITATIYVFQKDKAQTYRKSEGIIFTINGQTQGYLSADFFRRKSVEMSYLADSILVHLDCSAFSGRAREDLFMNSRDRLRNSDLRKAIERQLEILLKGHPGLRELREKRRREFLESKIADSKPLEDVLQSIITRTPSLAALFSPGTRISNPFKSKKVTGEEKEYVGKLHPTYFKFKDREYGKVLHRECYINMRTRITFETDVENDYFSRGELPGNFKLELLKNGTVQTYDNYVLRWTPMSRPSFAEVKV